MCPTMSSYLPRSYSNPEVESSFAYRVQVERSYYVSLRTLTGLVGETQCSVYYLLRFVFVTFTNFNTPDVGGIQETNTR
jgi:hypothetical protein